MTPGIWYSTICKQCVHSWISKKGAFTNWNLVVGEGRLMRNCPLCKKYSRTYTYFIKYFRGPLLVTQKFVTTPHPSVFCVSQHLHYCIFKLLNYFSHFSSLFIFFNSPFLQLFSHLCTPHPDGFLWMLAQVSRTRVMRQYMHFIRLTQEEMKVKTLTVVITREALCDKFL